MSLFSFKVYADNTEVLKEIKKLKSIIMATKEQFQQAFTEITASIDNIAADIQRLTEQLETGNLTDAEETEIFNQLRAVADRAKAIADATPENPTPEPTAPQA